MNSNLVLYEVNDRIGYITLNRPEKRNALSFELIDALKQTFSRAQKDETCKIVVLQARGDAFCAGADLAYLMQLQQNTYEENLTDSRHLMELFQILSTFPKIIISKVNGAALAGGCGLATVTDFCFASPESSFGYTEVKIGFIPALVMVFLTRRVSGSVARKLLLTGEIISASEAKKLQLITDVVEPDRLDSFIHQYATGLAKNTSPQSVATIKQMLLEIQQKTLEEGLEYAAEMNARARGEADCKKGIASFLNKEKIIW